MNGRVDALFPVPDNRTMLPEVEKLLVVQNRDQKIVSIEKELAGIPLEEEDIRDKLTEDQESVDAVKKSIQEVEIAIKNLELDIETRKDSIEKLKVQQFETKKNESYQAMGKEIENYLSEIAELEEQELELMEKVEGFQGELGTANEKLAESQRAVDEDIADLKVLQKNLEEEKAEQEKQKAEAASAVDEDLIEVYERLFKAKNGHAVVGLVDGTCDGCHMKVTQSTVADVKKEQKVAHCENCGRILYWWTVESDSIS